MLEAQDMLDHTRQSCHPSLKPSGGTDQAWQNQTEYLLLKSTEYRRVILASHQSATKIKPISKFKVYCHASRGYSKYVQPSSILCLVQPGISCNCKSSNHKAYPITPMSRQVLCLSCPQVSNRVLSAFVCPAKLIRRYAKCNIKFVGSGHGVASWESNGSEAKDLVSH